MSIHNLKMSTGHSIVEVEGQHFILDTGCMWTFRYDGKETLDFGDRIHRFLPASNLVAKLVKKKALDKLTGMSVDGMIGMDFLGTCSHIAFDLENHKVTFAHGYSAETIQDPVVIPFEVKRLVKIQPYISINTTTEKGDFRLFFDTGSFVNYISPRYINKKKPIGVVEDYSPELGKLRSKTYEMEVSFSGQSETMVVAKAPLSLRGELLVTSCKGVLSLCSFMEKYPKVILDLWRGEMICERR